MLAKTSRKSTQGEKDGRFLLKALKGPLGRRVAGKIDTRSGRRAAADGGSFLTAILDLGQMLSTGLGRLVKSDEDVFALNTLLTNLRKTRERIRRRRGPRP